MTSLPSFDLCLDAAYSSEHAESDIVTAESTIERETMSNQDNWEQRSSLYFHFAIVPTVDARPKVKSEERHSLACCWCSPNIPSMDYFINPQAERPSLLIPLQWEQHEGGRRYSSTTYYGILKLKMHLETLHQHFDYEFIVDDEMNLHIVVKKSTVVDYSNEDISKPYFFTRTDSTQQNKELFSQLVSMEGNGERNLQSQLPKGKKKTASTAIVPPLRAYYSAGFGRRLSTEECEYDSDDQKGEFNSYVSLFLFYCTFFFEDSSFELTMSLSRIDDFIDISAEEKQLMKLWNTHIFTFPPFGERLMPAVCQRFVERFANAIVEKNLRHNLLLHFLHLWDSGLLLVQEVEKFLEMVDCYHFQGAEFLDLNLGSSSSVV